MNKLYSQYIKNIFKIVAPSSITGAVVFMTSNRRLTEVGFDFLKWELSHNLFWILLILISIAIISFLIYNILKKKTTWDITYYRIKRVLLFTPMISIVVLTSAILAYIVFGLKHNYRYYSEVSHQKEILNDIKNERYIDARTKASGYLRLFPQRINGRLRDGVCWSVLDFTSGMAKFKRNIRSQNKMRPVKSDGLEIPILTETRNHAYRLANKMSGGAIALE